MTLKDKIVLVTGSSSGIGRAIAIECAKAGAVVLVHYRKNKKGAEETLREIKKFVKNGFIFHANLSEPRGPKKLFEEIRKLDLRVDILINNAGESKPGELDDLDKWDLVFKNIFYSVVYTTNEFLKHDHSDELRKILNISSIYGISEFGNPDYLQYCAAKAAVINLTFNLAKKLAPHVLVNTIAPGYTLTSGWDGTPEKYMKDCENLTRIKRFAKPEEIATMAIEVLKNDAMTGELIRVDGGIHLPNIL